MKLYSELATWWPLMSPPEAYAEEAEFYAQQLLSVGDQPARTLLELGSGGGNNASFMKKQFSPTLVEPGGAVLLAPDHVRENFHPPDTEHGGEDGDGAAMRWVAWTRDPDPSDSTYTVDYAYLLRGPDGSIRVDHDHHLEGLFSRAQWLEAMTAAGFQAAMVPCPHSDLEPGMYEVFVGVRPAA